MSTTTRIGSTTVTLLALCVSVIGFVSVSNAQENTSESIQAGGATVQVSEKPDGTPEDTKPSDEDLRAISALAEKSLNGTITAEEQVRLEASGATIKLMNEGVTTPPQVDAQPASSDGAVESSAAQMDIQEMHTNEANSSEEVAGLKFMVLSLVLLNILILVFFALYTFFQSRKHRSVV